MQSWQESIVLPDLNVVQSIILCRCDLISINKQGYGRWYLNSQIWVHLCVVTFSFHYILVLLNSYTLLLEQSDLELDKIEIFL
jgi:hypothetical protein